MKRIGSFVEHYRKQLPLYFEAAKVCAQQCETGVAQIGIRAIVTYRAKRPERLRQKVRERGKTAAYGCIEDMYADIRDLAGVRIALYFPGDRDEVDTFIRSQFRVDGVRQSPSEPRPALKYAKKFPGYSATHYHIRLKPETLTGGQKPCAGAPIEIQVASVLMHAWAEVEHDLVYKAQYGTLSIDELAILDELNGLTIAGEIALERLQRALKARLGKSGKRFANRYELAAFLYDAFRTGEEELTGEPVMGRTDILLQFLRAAKLDRPGRLRKYISSLSPDTEKASIVEQLVDRILLDHPHLYGVYAQARLKVASHREAGSVPRDTGKAGAYFMSRWIPFEVAVREVMRELCLAHPRKIIIPTPATLKRLKLFTPRTLSALETIRQLRNSLVHGMGIPRKEETLTEAGRYLEQVVKRLRSGASDRVRKAIDDALKSAPGEFHDFNL